ncbi:hypothetical protein BpHYR1_037863 [Brachionus plicatilis]|uniref:Uncharacterized protein n=1 Tax=Brachionus plicatilis TaxID=10195 RepID=A0A3M7RQX2_BRAPC|nr:hypothetical protein BpHYR1_037863 [Brachionus plicatilis]
MNEVTIESIFILPYSKNKKYYLTLFLLFFLKNQTFKIVYPYKLELLPYSHAPHALKMCFQTLIPHLNQLFKSIKYHNT